jgi:tetratricopeptide (TPR) repeat protein
MAQTLAAADWYDYYTAGKKAYQQGNWDKAIEELQKALADDNRPANSKRISGVQRTEYFPYYYLGLCHYRREDPDKAEEYFTQALEHGKLRDRERDEVTGIRIDLKTLKFVRRAKGHRDNLEHDSVLAVLRQVGNPAPVKYRDEVETLRGDAQGQIDKAYELAQQGQAHLQTRELESAREAFTSATEIFPNQREAGQGLRQLDQEASDYRDRLNRVRQEQNSQVAIAELEDIRSQYPDWYINDSLGELRGRLENDVQEEEFRNELRAQMDAGREALGAGRYQQAQTTFEWVLEQQPGYPDAVAGLQETSGKWAESLAGEGQGLRRRGRFEEADAKFRDAGVKDPTNSDAVRAVARADRYSGLIGDAERLSELPVKAGCQGRLDEASKTDSARFRADRRARGLEDICSQSIVIKDYREVVLQALSVYFSGSLEAARDILVELRSGAGEQNPDVRAFLGVVYASLSFVQKKDSEEQQAMESRAVEEFQFALRLQPQYALSSRLFSPLVLEVFENSKASNR